MWPHRSTLLWLFEIVSRGPAATVLWQTHFICTRPWLKAQMRRCQKLDAKNKKPHIFDPVHRLINRNWSTTGSSHCCPNSWQAIFHLLYWICPSCSSVVLPHMMKFFPVSLSPPNLANPISCFFLFCLENKFFRDKRSRDKEDYYAVFALRADFVLFCLLCL